MIATAMIGSMGVVLALFSTIGINALGNRVAVDAEGFGGVGNALLVPSEGFLDVELFKLGNGLIKCDVAVEHVVDY